MLGDEYQFQIDTRLQIIVVQISNNVNMVLLN